MPRYPFVTPASIPETVQCRTLQIPDDPAIIGIVNAALIQLIYASNYEQINDTDVSRQAIASRMLTMVWDYFNSGSECMGYCDQVLACLTDNPDVKQAIIDLLVGGGETITGQPYPYIGTLVIEPPYPTCDDDDRYGLAFRIVDIMHKASMDFLETLLLLTEVAEVAAQLVSVIPLLGPFAETLTEIATFSVNVGIARYEAAYDTTIQELIACAIFCDLKGECTLTVDDLWSVYNRLAVDLTPPGAFATITEVSFWFANLILLTDFEVAATMHYLMIELWRRGITIGGNSVRLLQIGAATAVPIPAADCGCCDTPDWLYDWYNANPATADDWTLLTGADIPVTDVNSLNDASGSYVKDVYTPGDGHYYLRGGGFNNNHQGVGVWQAIPDAGCQLQAVSYKFASSSPTCRADIKVWTYTTGGGWVFRAKYEGLGDPCPGTAPREGSISVAVTGAEKVAIIAYSDTDIYIWSLEFIFITP